MFELKQIKYNRLHQDIIRYVQSLEIVHYTEDDIYYDESSPTIIIYHTLHLILIYKFLIPFSIDDELLITAISKLLNCENYHKQITN